MSSVNLEVISLEVDLNDLQRMDKLAVATLLKAAVRSGSLDLDTAFAIGAECDIQLFDF